MERKGSRGRRGEHEKQGKEKGTDTIGTGRKWGQRRGNKGGGRRGKEMRT